MEQIKEMSPFIFRNNLLSTVDEIMEDKSIDENAIRFQIIQKKEKISHLMG